MTARGSPGPPRSGRELLGWIYRQPTPTQLLRRAERLGRAHPTWPRRIADWNADQVAMAYHDLSSKPPPGYYRWGGAGKAPEKIDPTPGGKRR